MGKFVVKKTATGYRFDLKAGNGEIIGNSEVYSGQASCMKGIDSVKRNSELAGIEDQTIDEHIKNPKFEIYLDKRGEHRFRLNATNGQNILSSEGYKSKDACKKGIESVKKNAPGATIEKNIE